jgi:glutamate/tyrosine decarboxylase-like PLP-dependent enzyme
MQKGKHVRSIASDVMGVVRGAALLTLPPPTAPAIVVLQAGHVNTGAFDEIGAVVAWARSGSGGGAGVWIHVDGAFGLWAAVSTDPSRQALVRGVGGCDSWATDLHKMLNVPYESALVAVKDGRTLHTSMSCAAPYNPPTPPASTPIMSNAASRGDTDAPTRTHAGSPHPLLPELQNSRRARGVAAWAALQQLGANGVCRLVDGCCTHAARLALLLQEGGAELLHPVVFNQALIRFGTDARTTAVAAAVQTDGRCWVGSTTYHGMVVIRLSVSSWMTTADDVGVAARAILECAKQCGHASSVYSEGKTEPNC